MGRVLKSKVERTLHLGKFYPPHPGGIETHVRDLAERQAKSHPVSVIVANATARHERATLAGVDVVRVARVATIASMPVCPGLTRAIRNQPAELVHLHVPNPGAALAFLRSGHPGKLVITHHADTMGRKALRKLADPPVRRAMERASVIVATSHHYLESSEELADFRGKCRVIPLGIDLDRCHNLTTIARDAESESGSGMPVILAVGRLVPYKGFDVLIRAMRGIDARLLIVGAGPEEPKLRACAAQENVQQKVEILGRVPDLAGYFRQASLFVLPSVTRAEAFGIAQLEAMAAGLPVVNTDLNSGVPEVSVHGQTGLTVPPGDAEALAAALRTLIERPELRREMGAAGRARVYAEYTADRMAERTAQIYEEVLRGPSN